MRTNASVEVGSPDVRRLVKAFRKQVNLLSSEGQGRYLAFLLVQSGDASGPVQPDQLILQFHEAEHDRAAGADTPLPLP